MESTHFRQGIRNSHAQQERVRRRSDRVEAERAGGQTGKESKRDNQRWQLPDKFRWQFGQNPQRSEGGRGHGYLHSGAGPEIGEEPMGRSDTLC